MFKAGSVDHAGIYIGNGLAVECTPSWEDGVQVTAVENIEAKQGYHSRYWTSHGKFKFINYAGVYLNGNMAAYIDEDGNRTGANVAGNRELNVSFDLITGIMKDVFEL